MARRKETKGAESCCGEGCCGGDSACCGLPASGCCQIEAVVTVDARGQMVLPKEVRESFGLASGEKLAVVVWKQQEKACCITLHKADELAERVRVAYGPLLKEIVR
jgi:antitoxin PrlF